MCYVEGTGIGPYEGARVTVEPSGKIRCATGVGTQGQGHFTVFAQIVADVLGVDVEDVRVVTGDTREFHWGTGTFASRGAVVAGSACHAAALAVSEKVVTLASAVLEAPKEKLELAGGRVYVVDAPERGLPLGELAGKANPLRGAVQPGTEPGLESTAYFGPDRGSTANGVHAMIVEVDPETAMVEIKRYLVVHDCGTIINPMLVEGQIHGGVAQGIGNAFYEQLVYDEQGQLLNASFMDYLIPTAAEIPPIETAHRETPSPYNPIGLKGVGEAGCIPTGALFAQAVEDALCGIGSGNHGNAVESKQAVRAPRTCGRAMILSGTYSFEGPRSKVWELLQDPSVLAKALPGTESLTLVSEDRYEGVMKVSVGPVNAAEFAVSVELKDKVPPEKFAMHIDGKGSVGFTRGTATVELQEAAGTGDRDDLQVRCADRWKNRRGGTAPARVCRQDDDATGA